MIVDNANILVVDDIAPNIRLVAGLLSPEGFEISFANSGKKALEQVWANDFDLILLDIMMPDMDGISVCKAIKENPAKRDIPIIFLTGKTDEISIAAAFDAGGVDYLYKPFNPVELVARVKTHLELKKARDIISQTNQELQEALTLKNQFLSLASHDLKNPLGAVHGYIKMITRDSETTIGPKSQRFMDSIQGMTQRMLEIISTILDKAALELGKIELKPKLINLMEVLRPLLEVYQSEASHKGQHVNLEQNQSEIWLTADRARLAQILDNLLSNAVKYSPLNAEIKVSLAEHKTDSKELVTIRIQDQGPGFSDEDKAKLFGYFQRLSAQPTGNESSNGIGLALTKQIVELHGGRIWVESEVGAGATFIVELPKKEA